MSCSPDGLDVACAGLSEDLAKLGELLVRLPPDARDLAASIYSRIQDSNRRRRKLLSLVSESIASMRLDIKYLEFDLIATRRERDACRELLARHDEPDEDHRWSIEDEADDS